MHEIIFSPDDAKKIAEALEGEEVSITEIEPITKEL